MKTRAYIGFSLGLALALTAPVSASATATTAVDPAVLGAVNAVVNYCRYLNPGVTGYWKPKASIFGKPSADTLAALRATTQYKESYKVVHDWVISTPKGWARQSCLDLVSSAGTG